METFVTWDRDIICLGNHLFLWLPLMSNLPINVLLRHISSERNTILNINPLDLKWITILQPIIRLLNLIAVDYLLLKNPIVVP